jgi:hypothetical protein
MGRAIHTYQSLLFTRELEMNRRNFLKISAGGLGTLLLPLTFRASASGAEDPHFFLNLYVQDGIDSLFLFDSRPLAMTGAGLIHDYVREEPQQWTGANGQACLTASYGRKLHRHRQNFSVVNGVFMATSFDGHPQNINFLFTGNPFGGESFVAHLNDRGQPGFAARPLDAIQHGIFPLDQTNGGATIPLTMDSATKLIEFLKLARPIDSRHLVMAFIQEQMRRAGRGPGGFGAGSREMERAYAAAPLLAERLKKLTIKPEPAPFEERFVGLVNGCFRHGVCSSATIRIGPSQGHLDVHAASSAKNQPAMYDSVSGQLERIFDLLAQTEFDSGRSLLDVTTVFVASEFGRTLRQPSLPLDETGTDHNCLNNSVLIGGKKIKGGLVIGETDFRAPGEVLSGAHKILDRDSIKLIGKPFDFVNSRPRPDKPDEYKLEDYLTIASLVNTIYSAFSVPQKHWRTLNREGLVAPVLHELL